MDERPHRNLYAAEKMGTQVQRLPGSTYGDITVAGDSRVQLGNTINHFTFVLHRERTLSIAPEERIGVTASIAGLVRQAEALHTSLEDIYRPISSLVLDHWEAKDLFEQLQAAKEHLVDLQKYLSASDLAQSRAALIHADQLVASFTNAVLLFRDIQKDLYYFLQPDPTVSDEQYNEASSRIPGLTKRLVEQNCIWTLQLRILTSANEKSARHVSRNLDAHIAILLAENADLKSRMDGLEHEVRSRARTSTIAASEVMSLLEERRTSEGDSENEARFSLSSREFEKVLALSRVYQQHKHGSEVFDFDSSVLRSHAWSRLSDLSLSNVSIISVIALPVWISEVDEDGEWYTEKDPQTIPEAPDDDFEDDDDGATIRQNKARDSRSLLAEELEHAFHTLEHPSLSDASLLQAGSASKQSAVTSVNKPVRLKGESVIGILGTRLGKKIDALRAQSELRVKQELGGRNQMLQELFPPTTPRSTEQREAFEKSTQKAMDGFDNGRMTSASDRQNPLRSFFPGNDTGQFENPRAPPVAPKRPVNPREYPDPGPPPPVPSAGLADKVPMRLGEAEEEQIRSGAKQARMHPAESTQERMRIAEAAEERLFFESTHWQPVAATPTPVAPRFRVPTGPSNLFDWAEQEPRWPNPNAEKTPDPVAEVLFSCASLFDFNLEGDRREAGYCYLTYAAGEVFEVVRQRGELWLAWNQDDPEKKLGWIWEKHAARLIGDDESDAEDDAATEPAPVIPDNDEFQKRGSAATSTLTNNDMPRSKTPDSLSAQSNQDDSKETPTGILLDSRTQRTFDKVSSSMPHHIKRDDRSLEILFTCISLRDSERAHSNEAGFPCHYYRAGDIFDVVALGENLMLAKSRVHADGTLGWVQENSFERSQEESHSPGSADTVEGIWVKQASGKSMKLTLTFRKQGMLIRLAIKLITRHVLVRGVLKLDLC